MLHFTYEPKPSKTELMQGDVLRRTPEIDELLKEVHPHFYKNQENLLFIVLTQSCDLVRRKAGEPCKSPYITIAPVRSLDLVVQRYLAQQSGLTLEAEILVLSAKAKGKATEFLTRVFNNNEAGYFYLDAEDTELPCDCVAFLNLSIAIKAEKHYQKCLDAKITQLNGTFQAKLGWLVGHMYSRVGTEDIPQVQIAEKLKSALKDVALCIEDQKVAALEKAFAEFKQANPGVKMTEKAITKVLVDIPSRKTLVFEQTDRIIKEALGEDNAPLYAKLRKRLENDSALISLLK
jgi:hypothetical protein